MSRSNIRVGRGGVVAAMVAVAAALAGCGAPSEGETGDTFLAFASHFQGFRHWESFDVPPGDPSTVHTLGPRVEYLKKRPSDGATEFPVGTIIVKESTTEALPDRSVFAMVKRGGNYNASGATGWEWFELQNIDEEKVDVLWRGVGPPAGEKYGGDPNAGCNSCHEGAADNDFVLGSALDLEAL